MNGGDSRRTSGKRVVLLACLAVLMGVGIARMSEAAVYTNVCTADTHIRNNSATVQSNNYGAATTLILGSSASSVRKNLYRFDMTAVTETITAVVLRVTAGGVTGSQTLAVFGLADGNSGWVEGTNNATVATDNGSTWQYRNHKGATNWLGSPGLGSAGTDYYSAQLGSAEINADGLVQVALGLNSIAHWRTNGLWAGLSTVGSWVWFYSREEGTPSNRPQLIVYTAATDAPWVDITNGNQTVDNAVAQVVLGGTASTNVVGAMRWSNSLTGEEGTLVASTHWGTAGIALQVGENFITVTGTNGAGLSASDSIVITRLAAGIGGGYTNRHPEAVIFKDPASNDRLQAYAKMLAALGLEYDYVFQSNTAPDEAEIDLAATNVLLLGNGQAKHSLFLHAGGGQYVGGITAGHLREYVRGGGSFWGTCMGAWNAAYGDYGSSVNNSGIGLIGMQADGSKGASNRYAINDYGMTCASPYAAEWGSYSVNAQHPAAQDYPYAVVSNVQFLGSGVWETNRSGSWTGTDWTQDIRVLAWSAGFPASANYCGGTDNSFGATVNGRPAAIEYILPSNSFGRVVASATHPERKGAAQKFLCEMLKYTAWGATKRDPSGNRRPSFAVSASDESPTNAQSVTLTAAPVTDPDGDTVVVRWCYDQAVIRNNSDYDSPLVWGRTGTSASVAFSSGSYPIRILARATDNGRSNRIAERSLLLGVSPDGAAAEVSFNFEANGVSAGNTYTCTVGQVVEAGFSAVSGQSGSYYYDFGDGDYREVVVSSDSTVYATPGTYLLSGALRDANNRWVVKVISVVVLPRANPQVEGRGLVIQDGDDSPSVMDGTLWATNLAQGSRATGEFVIAHAGYGDLSLSNGPAYVSVSNLNGSPFSVALQPAFGTVPEMGGWPFKIVYAPTTTGSHTAVVTIANSGPSPKSQYTFAVMGVATGEGDSDADADGIPNQWEEHYFGGSTNADPNAVASNGLNTMVEAYVAGLNPTSRDSFFQISDGVFPISNTVLSWNSVTGRYYAVDWATNLQAAVWSNLADSLAVGSFTDAVHVHQPQGYYRISVRMP